jgi:ketosteroid isomerase-like protein
MSVLRPSWLLIFFISACNGDEVESNQDRDTLLLKDQLVEIAEMTVSGLPTEEMTERYLSYFSDNPTLLPPGQSAVLGRDAIGEFYNSAFDGLEILGNQYHDVVVEVTERSAVRRYLGTAMFRVSEDAEPISVTNRYIDVLEKFDGSWEIVWHSWTPAVWLQQNDT